ncbi:MAG TPA: 2-oxoglutarate dehydrogenase E1 component [Candidatus Acidoferrum sp.]|nr:2-oxoglutarate dehydrogenase E1 component [Candidatus Acidoferrum sp.]
MKDGITSAAVYSLEYLEGLYARYLHDHQSVPAAWRERFADLHNGDSEPAHAGPSFRARSLFNPAPTPTPRAPIPELDPVQGSVRDRLNQLIRNYRVRGHMIAHLDPLGAPRPTPPELELAYYGFRESDLDLLTVCSTLPYDEPLTIREIVQRLRNTYCRSIGVQFMHLDDHAARAWLQHRMESTQNHLALSRAEQLRILAHLTDAVIFEEFLRKKFLGAKTFSLEGSETLVPLLDLAIEGAARQGVRDIVIGMAHRGRLNVLANIIGKPRRDIFREFADAEPGLWTGRGDVRYHLGASGTWTTTEGVRVQLALCFNPSHLEFINPVAVGRVRARQDRQGDTERRQVLGVLIHGDAAFPAEGIVQETLNLSQLPAYTTGGTLHVVVNNQIGFTTSPSEARSTVYATDIARMLQSPVFHVNGEDPEAVAQVVRLALDFRREFGTDVFIDMYGYRRWGHNETDEPSFTQPLLYRAIHQRRSIRECYLEHLRELKGITTEEAEDIARLRRERLEQQLSEVRQETGATAGQASRPAPATSAAPSPPTEPDTRVDLAQLRSLLLQLARLPRRFHLHPKLERGLEARRKMAEQEHPLDWSSAEALALASLAVQGTRIRLSGQDTGRGTFSQRHAVLYDQEEGYPYVPLQHLAARQAPVEIINSPLSEAGALGFEYGYSLDSPDCLVLWEAQFGDFVNAAEVCVDQFIASAEDKWQQLSGLVLLLPHGFEGMGPEHSSARLERFLQLAAEDNIRVVQPTTPAQYFHCLRRQALSQKRKPLIVLTPKSLLRHPQAISPLADCAEGALQTVLRDSLAEAPVSRVLLCTGKVYYELAAHREEHHRADVAIIRLEQLYPLSVESLEAALPECRPGALAFWVQEEPENMGAWHFVHDRLGDRLRPPDISNKGEPARAPSPALAGTLSPSEGERDGVRGALPLRPVCRPESASPATGSAGAHKLEQEQLIERAFGEPQAAAPAPVPAGDEGQRSD